MTLQVISRGAAAGDPSADTLYDAFGKTIANFAELYGIYGSEIEAFTFTTKQDDLALAAGTRILRWNGAGTTGITGIAAPSTARVVTIVNASTDYLLWLENENTASAAANRLMLPDGFLAFLMPGDTITLFYDLTTARWRVLSWPTRGMGMGLTTLDDFDANSGGLYPARISGSGATGSSGTTTGVNETSRANGVRYAGTGTTSAGYASIARNSSSMTTAPTLGAAIMISRAILSNNPSGAETFTALFGLHDGTSGTFANGAVWERRWTGSAVEVDLTVASGGAVARAVSAGIGSPNSWYWLGVFLNPGWTRADFLCSTDGKSFVVDGVVSSGLPSVSQLVVPALTIIKSAGSTDRGFHADLLGHRIDQVRA